jgi:hypothetical protein
MMKNTKTIRLLFRGALVLGVTAAALLLGSCFAPISQTDEGVSFDVSMGSKAAGETRVLAGFVAHSEFEETMKDITQLMAATDAGDFPDFDDELEEQLIDLALGATVKFSGNPFFAVEVPYNTGSHSAGFEVNGIPAGQSYLLLMGGFDTMDHVKQFFGLMDEDGTYDEDNIPYSNIFYVYGTEDGSNRITVPFSVPGYSFPAGFVIDDSLNDVYSGAGWYYLDEWSFPVLAGEASILAKANFPFEVKAGKKTTVNVQLTGAASGW